MLPMIASRYLRALYDTAAIRRREQASFREEGESFAMMMRAGQALWRHIRQQVPQLTKLAVVAGSGNNGADGLVVAHLASEEGVTVHLYDMVQQPREGDAKRAYALLQGAAEVVLKDISMLPQERAPVVLDALLGIGFHPPLSDAYKDIIEIINTLQAEGAITVSVDTPSGLEIDTGSATHAVQADWVVSFIGDKIGHHLHEGAVRCNAIAVESLQAVELSEAPQAYVLDSAALHDYTPCARTDFSHKGSYGHVSVLGGDLGFGGAAIMASEAAAMAGAGTVSLVTQADHISASLTRNPNIMCLAGDEQALASTLRGRSSVLVVGPGLGRSSWSQKMWHACQDLTLSAAVIDADGLHWLKQSKRLIEKLVITPHPGEAAMLLDKSVEEVLQNLPAAARALSNTYHATTVLKGATTVVASVDSDVVIVGRPCPALAKGGAGDVLSGIIGACLAYYPDAFDAAVLGVAWHNQAALRCREQRGSISMQPYQLLQYLE